MSKSKCTSATTVSPHASISVLLRGVKRQLKPKPNMKHEPVSTTNYRTNVFLFLSVVLLGTPLDPLGPQENPHLNAKLRSHFKTNTGERHNNYAKIVYHIHYQACFICSEGQRWGSPWTG